MDKKSLIRKKYFLKRKKNYFDIDVNYFLPLIKLLKKIIKNKDMNIAIYFPHSYEVNILKILEVEYFKKFNFLLPIIKKNNSMKFYKWKKNDVLLINRYGIPEPVESKEIIPSLVLLPLLAYDKNKNRIGYGKGFYDKFLYQFLKTRKKIFTVGVAFSFQKHHKLPNNKKDFKLDYIITDKGII